MYKAEVPGLLSLRTEKKNLVEKWNQNRIVRVFFSWLNKNKKNEEEEKEKKRRKKRGRKEGEEKQERTIYPHQDFEKRMASLTPKN